MVKNHNSLISSSVPPLPLIIGNGLYSEWLWYLVTIFLECQRRWRMWFVWYSHTHKRSSNSSLSYNHTPHKQYYHIHRKNNEPLSFRTFFCYSNVCDLCGIIYYCSCYYSYSYSFILVLWTIWVIPMALLSSSNPQTQRSTNRYLTITSLTHTFAHV